MKVLLVNVVNNMLSELAPIGLMSISSYIKENNHDVMLCDIAAGHNFYHYLDNYKPDVVAISTMTNFAYLAYTYARVSCSKGIYTVLGGCHPSAVPEEAIQFCDAVVIGEGEKTLLHLIESREKGIFKGESLEILGNIDYSIIDFNHYSNSRKRQHNSIWSFVAPFDNVMNSITSIGCNFLCVYCHNNFSKIKIRYRSIDNILNELQYMKEHNINAVHFVDDNFLLDKKRTESLCSEIEQNKLGMYYSISARSSSITDDVLEMLRNANVLQIAFGFESGNQRILNVLKKGTKVEDNKRAIELCNKHDFTIQGSFMFGNPTETLEEMKETEKFIKTNYMDGGLGTFLTTPYPATELWNWAKTNNKIPDGITWDKLAFHKNNPIVLHDVPKGVFDYYFTNILSEADNIFSSRNNERMNRVNKLKEMIK